MSTTQIHTSIADEIFVSWRNKPGHARNIVGRFYRNESQVDFHYLLGKETISAIQDGFSGIGGFSDFGKTYQNVGWIIANRLIDKDRSDRIKYLQFWSADDNRYDDFDLVALTQAWLTNDRLEFLGNFIVSKDLLFVSDLAGQSKLQIQLEDIAGESELDYRLVELENYEHPKVEIRNSKGKEIGALKRVHCQTIPKALEMGLTPKFVLKDQERNGVLKKIFVEVSFS